MLERTTTFVIGAGASHDFEFPLGDRLRDRIISVLNIDDPNRSINFSDPSVATILQDRAAKDGGDVGWLSRIEVYRNAATIIRNGLPFARSIDTFVDGLRDDQQIRFLAKLAIALVILRAETGSPLGLGTNPRFETPHLRDEKLQKLRSSWHVELSQILFDGHTAATLDSVFENASFIVFNYDRCLEEFLTISLMRRLRFPHSGPRSRFDGRPAKGVPPFQRPRAAAKYEPVRAVAGRPRRTRTRWPVPQAN